MRAWILVFGLLVALPAWANESVSRGNCRGADIDNDDANVYVNAQHGGGLTLFPNGETVSLTLYTCSSIQDTSTCDVLLWDHDGNGTKTQGSLDGVGATLTRGTYVPEVPVIRAEVAVAPATDDTVLLLLCEAN